MGKGESKALPHHSHQVLCTTPALVWFTGYRLLVEACPSSGIRCGRAHTLYSSPFSHLPPFLHPELSAAQDDCDWFKKYKQDRAFFPPYATMIASRARPFSSTVLKQSVAIGLAMRDYTCTAHTQPTTASDNQRPPQNPNLCLCDHGCPCHRQGQARGIKCSVRWAHFISQNHRGPRLGPSGYSKVWFESCTMNTKEQMPVKLKLFPFSGHVWQERRRWHRKQLTELENWAGERRETAQFGIYRTFYLFIYIFIYIYTSAGQIIAFLTR